MHHILFDLSFLRFDKLITLQSGSITCSRDVALKEVKVHLFYIGAELLICRHGDRHFACGKRFAARPSVVLTRTYIFKLWDK